MKERFENSTDRDNFTNTLLTAITACFPGSTITQDGDRRRVTGFTFPDGRRVWIGYDGWKHRLNIHGGWPQTKLQGTRSGGPMFTPRDVLAYNEENPYTEITVDAAKPAEKIAADISRRFLPGYDAMYARCCSARDRHEAAIASQNSLAAELAQLVGLPGAVGGRGQDEKNSVHLSSLPGDVYGEIDCRDGRADFRLRNVSADKARKLAAFIKTL